MKDKYIKRIEKMSEFIKKNKVALALFLVGILVNGCIAYSLLSFNKNNFEVTHQGHGQITQEIEKIPEKIAWYLESESSVFLFYDKLLKQCFSDYDDLLEAYSKASMYIMTIGKPLD